jgi:hypothetical protein
MFWVVLFPNSSLGTALLLKLCFAFQETGVSKDMSVPKQSLGTRKARKKQSLGTRKFCVTIKVRYTPLAPLKVGILVLLLVPTVSVGTQSSTLRVE